MWLLNRKSIIELENLSYKRWEEVKWAIKFDFGGEVVKADKITKIYSFEVVARVDIPWAIYITEKVAINVSSD